MACILTTLQALAVSIIAPLGVWIAARQMVIAQDKFELDAFDRQYDRRLAVWEATRSFLERAGNLTDDDIRAYGLCTLGAQFLFDEHLCKYLEEIHFRVAAYNSAKCSAEQLPPGDEKTAQERIRNKYLEWIIDQGSKTSIFATAFTPFLKYEQRRRAFLLRWPT